MQPGAWLNRTRDIHAQASSSCRKDNYFESLTRCQNKAVRTIVNGVFNVSRFIITGQTGPAAIRDAPMKAAGGCLSWQH
jgi:hypothetical protein